MCIEVLQLLCTKVHLLRCLFVTGTKTELTAAVEMVSLITQMLQAFQDDSSSLSSLISMETQLTLNPGIYWVDTEYPSGSVRAALYVFSMRIVVEWVYK
jgi:hypothetical protein